jgi:uncharacterized protein (TIGR03437 family)
MPQHKLSLIALLLPCLFPASAQTNRINAKIDNKERVTLAGHLHPKALAEYDQGRVSPSLPISYVTLALANTADQQVQLDQLLADQQNPSSPQYHQWLTPEEYAQRFGVSDADVAAVTAWLKSQGLAIAAVARGRTWIAVNGTAAQIESAFQTELHQYQVNGEMHFANATEPSVPAALSGVIRGFRGLNDFRLRPHLKAPHAKAMSNPDYNSSRGNHYLAPDDVATIYDISPLIGSGITGSGQRIVVVGQTQVDLTDIAAFRTKFGLSSNVPQVMLVPNTSDPGLSSLDLPEADLDLEWSAAVARDAAILYIYSSDVTQAVQYAIDQNLAPVLSSSYGLCELESLRSDTQVMRSWAQQGNAQGITWVNASGDSGAADCDDSQNPGLSVDVPADIPEVTGIGGTEFAEGSGQFWNTTNSASLSSVLSYIPEMVWNDSVEDDTPSSSGGGASDFFTKPSWQTGRGVPGDNARDVPDVSMNASADHDGYLVFTGGSLQVYGGTSVPTPVFAGLAALLNQYTSSQGLGNMNPKLYSLAQSTSNIFHDITSGDNIVTVTCPAKSLKCVSSPVGYSAGAGYDQATGLGSMDAYNLAVAWSGGRTVTLPPPSANMTLVSSLNPAGISDTVFLIATVINSNGDTPSGAVSFSIGGNSLGLANLVGSAGTATATLAITGAQASQGSGTIQASFNGVTASVTVSVQSASRSQGVVTTVGGVANGASFKTTYAPGMLLSVFGSQLAPSVQAAGSVPLPVSMAGVAVTVNGVASPLYYVSPGQINLQIPYTTASNSNVLMSVNNNGKVTTKSFTIGTVSPGIFVDQNNAPVPSTSAARGQTVTLFITGAGALTPPVATGTAPSPQTSIADLPAPVQPASVTVGGVNAPIAFIGNTVGLVGVIQINYKVPSGISTGAQPVLVSVGGVVSAPALLNITN